MPLDYPTLLVVNCLITCILCGAQFLVWWSNREIPAMLYWALSSLLVLSIFLIYPIVKDQPDQKLWALLAAIASVCAFLSIWAGVRVFASKPPFAKPALVGAALYIAAAAITLLIIKPNDNIDPNVTIYARTLFQSPIIAIFLFLIARDLLTLPKSLRDPATRAVGFLVFFEATFFVARFAVAAHYLLDPVATPPYYFIFSLSFLQFSIFLIAVNIGFLVITTTRLQTQLRRQATTDALTGVPNRRSFMERAELEFKRSRRTGSALSLVIIDIDHFKSINDTRGHLTGDLVLKDVAKHLSAAMRATDLFCRWGGEEFCALLPETPTKGAYTLLERLRAQVASVNFDHNGHPLTVTISVGISQIDPNDKSLDDTIARADKALYTAKNTGRNRVTSHPPDPRPDTPAISPAL